IERVVSAIHLTRLMDVAETNFGPVDLVIGMKFPAYLMPHPSRVLWLLHQYRQMYDLWDEPGIGFGHVAGADALREAGRTVDRLPIEEHSRTFAISNTVRERLKAFCDTPAEVLYPPIADAAAYHTADPDSYFFYPSRITPLKRHSLVVEAVARMRRPVT